MNEETKDQSKSAAPVAHASSNKTIKIVFIVLVVLAILGYGAKYLMGMLFMGAVNTRLAQDGVQVSGNPLSGGSYTVTDKNGNKVDVDTSGAGYQMTDQKGNKVVVGAGAAIPSDFPSSIPVYSGATVVANTTSNDGGKTMHMVSLTTKDAADIVAAFYKKSLSEGGWKILQETNMAAGYSMFTAENGTLQANVMIQGAQGSETSIVLTAGEKS